MKDNFDLLGMNRGDTSRKRGGVWSNNDFPHSFPPSSSKSWRGDGCSQITYPSSLCMVWLPDSQEQLWRPSPDNNTNFQPSHLSLCSSSSLLLLDSAFQSRKLSEVPSHRHLIALHRLFTLQKLEK
jgi:hypothetical protein